MNLSSAIQAIERVDANSRVNLFLELNEKYTLLIEGAWSLSASSDEVISSYEYVGSDFSGDILQKVRALIEGQEVTAAFISSENASITLELKNSNKFESFFGEGDYESWELRKDGEPVYASECGTILSN
ncbi:hypothetical protein [Zooshikella sp. RANM57]|uniref:hypothetical protein n=1 Tax=Zooshikella sp. RANM57 TaxID=3425863 RepID=UPI003D6F61EC